MHETHSIEVHQPKRANLFTHLSSHISGFGRFFHYNKRPDYVLRMCVFFVLYPLLGVSKTLIKSNSLYNSIAHMLNKLANKQLFETPFGTYICDSFDEYGRMNKQYEHHIKKVIKENAKKHQGEEKTFLNIGSNSGRWFVEVVKNYGYKGIAFEPSAYTFQKLQNNCFLSGIYDKSLLFNYGLGAQESEVEYYYNKLYPGSSFFMNENQIRDKDNDVFEKKVLEIKYFDGMNIDQELLSKVRLVIIDVEGFELEVLKGMTNFLSQSKDIDIIIEIHQQSKQWHEVNEIFTSHGFHKHQLDVSDWLFRKH